MSSTEQNSNAGSVAIVGLAGRFPGAKDVHQFWSNLANGVESITRLKDEELEAGDASLWSQPDFVKARGILEDVDLFDANFWGMLPREAETTDPQHRVFMECAWQVLEDAGYDSATYKGAVGVFAGCSMNTYFLLNLCSDRKFVDEFTRTYQVGSYPTLVGNHIDFLATRVAYKLNLRGPAYTMQCGCSTSLVAVCQACQSLLTYQSDMALAGGVSASFPQKRGYLYQPDGMASPDGHCRTFDAQAQGTVFGSGVAVVLLKRLDDAIVDRDHIYAVIKGFALNNDGSAKVGFAAPGVEGQAQVIAMAQAAAGVTPESISYIEAHGTGTPLGDPIEVAAATKVFRASTKAKGFCVIGTAKTNVGHLDIAAGATGLIKTVLSLKHNQLPPSLHFEKPNPKLDLENSPFYVNTKLTEWKRSNGQPRRAGVSAFGVGGTNAHVIIEEAPVVEASQSARELQLLVLSAKTTSALDRATVNLEEHLKKHNDVKLADVAYTLQIGRRPFEHRRFVVARDAAEAIQRLETLGNERIHSGVQKARCPVVFMFPGQGAQYCQMGAQLYGAEPEFRMWVDECADILKSLLPKDLREVMHPKVMHPTDAGAEDAQQLLTSTSFAQPALFTIEFALAKLWMSWGIQPEAIIGHSIGEFVAACLGGVFSLADALRLVVTRGRMMQDLPSGSMMAVRLPESELRSYLSAEVSIAAINSPALCVVSGPTPAIDKLEKLLNERGVMARRLHTSHAFHSSMMDPVVGPFTEVVKQISLRPTSIPYVSGVSGDWVTEEQTTSPNYWASHLRKPVRFADGLASLAALENAVLLEVGPGMTLNTLALQHPAMKSGQTVVNSLPDVLVTNDTETVLNALGRIWVAGVQPDWKSFHRGERLHRVSLPTYPFERKRYWISPTKSDAAAEAVSQQTDELKVSVRTEPQQTMNPTIPSPQKMSEPTVQSEVSMSCANKRQERVQQTLLSMFQELSGISAADLDPAASFMELGFDSLFLTQVTQELQNKFGLKITFRQLLDQESTVQALAAYIHGKIPPEAAQPVAVPVTQTSAAPLSGSPVPVSVRSEDSAGTGMGQDVSVATAAKSPSSLIESLMKEQLRTMSDLMSRQLETLRSGGVGTMQAPAVAQAESTHTAPVSARTVPQPELKPAPGPAAETAKEEPKAFGPYKPLSKGQQGALTPQQQEHIAALIDRYTRKTAESKRLTQKYRQVMADPRVVAGFRSQWKEIVYPIVTNRSEGSKLYDVDGNEYIDILNGYGPTVFGHKPKFVTEAVQQQLELGFEIGPMSPLAGKVAELISEFTGMERVAFSNTGSEAVLCAMRIARTATGRNKIVMFTGDYHGMFDEVLVRGVNRPGQPARSLPIAPGIPPQAAENIVVLDYGTQASLDYIRAHASEFAAVMVEPVQSRHPNLQPREFLHELRKITADSGTALIFDEVVTGFRTHPGGAQAIFGIQADIATYGKIIGGGLPIGILAGKSQFMDTLDGGMWRYGDDSFPEVGVTFFAGTFVRHPLALAATYSVLQHLKEQGPQLQERLNEKTAKMVARLNAFLRERELPLEIQNFASIFYFSFPIEMRFGSLFYYHMRERGIHIQEGFPCFLTTAHSEADVEQIITSFQQSIAEMQADGMLPGIPELSASCVDSKEAEMLPQSAAVSSVCHDSLKAPVTEAQKEIWLSDQIGEDASCSYNESFSLSLKGLLNETALKEALYEVINRHEALRATFTEDGESVKVAPQYAGDISFTDLSSLSPTEREQKRANIVSDDARTPFDISGGPLVRIKVLRLEPENHIVVFTSHHIVCDGWSTNVILEELAQLYSAKLEGRASNLPEPKSFLEYAREKSQLTNTPAMRQIEEYWLNQFEKPAPVLELPTDRPRSGMKSFAGATHRTTITASEYHAIKRAGAQRGCTLFVTLLAVYELLMCRLSNQDDVVVGIPTAGQALLEGAPLVGHCVNFLALRAQINKDLVFSEFVKQIKKSVLDAYEHQNYTYGTLVRKLGIPRDPSRLPLIEVQFNLERIGSAMKIPGLRAEVDPNPKAFVNFDLFLNVVESDQGLTLDCDYNSDLFDESTIARWISHYQTLLQEFVADANRSVMCVPLLTPAERKHLLDEWNATQADYPAGIKVHQLFEEQVARTPDSVALVCNDQTLTYEELDERANQLAHYLQAFGAGPDKKVGLFVERSVEMIVGLLGILKSGACYVPLDPSHPKSRIDYILGEANSPIVVTQKSLANGLTTSARLLLLDSDWARIESQPSSKPREQALPNHLAYVLFTSGSTGKPKGVEVTHQSLVNLICSVRKQPGMNTGDTALSVTTISFDVATGELLVPLSVGARVVIASADDVTDGSRLREQMEKHNVTAITATPGTFRLLAEAGWKSRAGLKIWSTGEALPRELANTLLAGGSELWDLYGPTETTIWSVLARIESTSGPVPIGRPVENTQVHVVDEFGEPVPIGVAGELWIGGDGVARGYLNDPQLTAERFIPDPFRGGNGRIYRTGDLVRYRADGVLEYMGRLDRQVKVRGFRIELGEIESVLNQAPAVRESAVIVREDNPGDRRLIAYYTADDGTVPSATDLRAHLGRTLPDYMVPSAFVKMDALPRTPNGKLDKRGLPAPELSAAKSNKGTEPRNAEEQKMSDIWAEVLRLKTVGIDDSLFELGADSLHVFQIVARANKAGMKVTPKLVLQQRTIRAILEQAKEAAGNGNGVAPVASSTIVPVSREKYRVTKT
jgi:amino acid adenylation domain-containing protein